MLSFKWGEPEKEVVIWQFLKAVRVATRLGLWRRGGCPQCGAEMDVYTSSGRIVEDSVCSKCGYTIKAQEQVVPGLKREKEE